MNHPFLPSQLNPLQCHNCKRPESDHGIDAQCESCSNIGPCMLVGQILMCASCQAANGVSSTSGRQTCDVCGGSWPTKPFGNKHLCDICLKKEYSSAIETARENDKRVRNNGDYFVARTMPIAEVKELIDLAALANGDTSQARFELHKFVRERFEHFAEALFTKVTESSAQSNQQLVIEFRAQVRDQIKASDIQYQPKEKAPKVSTPRMGKAKPKSIQEKMAMLLVASEAKKGNVISLAQAIAKIEADFS